MRVQKPIRFLRGLSVALMVAVAVTAFATVAPAAEGPALAPAEYKPLPVGTRIKYDNRIYTVSSTDGFLTVFKNIVSGNQTSYLWAHALFGEYQDNLHGSAVNSYGMPTPYTLDDDSKKKLEAFWPLKVGKKLSYKLNEGATSASTAGDVWHITLEVLKTEFVNLNGYKYVTFLVKEQGVTDSGKSYAGQKWYQPGSGLIIKSNRIWTKSFVTGGGASTTTPHFVEGEEDNFKLVDVTFPEGTTTHALKGTKVGGATDKVLLAKIEELEKKTEEARKAAQSVGMRTISEAASDSAAWEEIKHSNRVSDFQRYLEKHPNGMFVKLAESQMRALIERQADPDAVKNQFAGIDFGAYYALIIGINDYKNLPKLKTAVRDAKAMASMLENNYGFKVSMLIDPERADIIDALDEYRETLGPTDNLLIYYAGHGWLDEESGEGYWLTRSAKKNRRSRWISNATITNTLKVLSAKHVMVVADSCYSGTLTRSAAIGFRDKDYYRRMASKQARVAMVSGGLEPVADDSGKGNSPFATAFLDALRKNPDVIDGTRLFSEIRRPVILNAQQTPEYSDVRNAGHDGGDFLFVRTK